MTEEDRIWINDRNRSFPVNIDEIIYCEADGCYTRIYSAYDIHIVCKTLKNFEQKLPPELFLRIHHKFLVNKCRIKEILRYKHYVLVMSNGVKIPVSARRKQIIKNLL